MRRLDGWEPVEVHDHEYDEAGRLVRTVITREAEWDATERAWMLGLAAREAAECRRCGGDLVETTNYDHKYVPLPPVVCLHCAALQASERSHSKHPNANAMIHRAQRTVRPKPKTRRR